MVLRALAALLIHTSAAAAQQAVGGGVVYSVLLNNSLWTARPKLPEARSDLTCDVLGGLIYCVGGCSAAQACPGEAGLADPNGEWCYCPSTSASMFVFDPALNSWSRGPDAPRARYRHASAVVDIPAGTGVTGGVRRLFLFGGRDATDGIIQGVDMYDAEKGAWSSVPGPAADVAAAGLASDSAAFVLPSTASAAARVYVAGGWTADYSAAVGDVLKFDPFSASWQRHRPPAMQFARGDLSAVAIGGKGYVFGGFSHIDRNESDQRSAFCDPVSHLESSAGGAEEGWAQLRGMNEPRGDHAAVALGTHLWVLGGEQKHAEHHMCDKVSVPVQDVEYYDTESNRWWNATALPHPRMRFAAAELDGNIFVVGGQAPIRHHRSGSGGGSGGASSHDLLDWVESYRPCDDGRMNGGETGVDCGGPCRECPALESGAARARGARCAAALAAAAVAAAAGAAA